MFRASCIPLILSFMLVIACDDDGKKHLEDAGCDACTDAEVDADADGGGDVEEPVEFDSQRIFDDVAWLAHDDRAGRMPGTTGNMDSVEYVRARFAELGLTPGGDGGTFLQAFDFSMWELTGDPAVSLDGAPLDPGIGFQVMQYSGAGLVDAELVFAGHGMTVPPFDPAAYPDCPLPATGYDDFADVDVTGRIAVVMRRGPANLEAIHDHCPANEACLLPPCPWNFGYKTKNAALHGAAGVMVVNSYHQEAAIPSDVTLGAEYHVADLPVVFVDRGVMESALPELPAWSAAIDADLTPHSAVTGVGARLHVETDLLTATSHNVVGIWPGSDPELAGEVIVVGAHLDHVGQDPASGEIYNGADDNASGTAVMMELARAFASGGRPTARTLVFAAWNAEELGLVGSCHHVQYPAFPLSRTVAAFSIDMVGAGNGTGLAVFGGNVPEHSWLVEVMNGYATELDLGFSGTGLDPLDASDHVCFAYNGVPAVLLTTFGPHGYYHTPEDTIDTILPRDLEVAVWLSWAGIRPLAMGTEHLFLDQLKNAAPAASPPTPREFVTRRWRHR